MELVKGLYTEIAETSFSVECFIGNVYSTQQQLGLEES